MIPPIEIQPLLKKMFLDQKAYGQLATVNQHQCPALRTVHFQMAPSLAHIWINTHTQSEKWHDIKRQPSVAGCYWVKSHQVQIRFKAKARLISALDLLSPAEKKQHHDAWQSMRPEVRLAYLLSDQNIPLHQDNIAINPEQHSPQHGLVECDVFRWDMFYESAHEYRFGIRDIYELDGQKRWQKKTFSSLHENPVLL